jgi:hypothetical protein
MNWNEKWFNPMCLPNKIRLRKLEHIRMNYNRSQHLRVAVNCIHIIQKAYSRINALDQSLLPSGLLTSIKWTGQGGFGIYPNPSLHPPSCYLIQCFVSVQHIIAFPPSPSFHSSTSHHVLPSYLSSCPSFPISHFIFFPLSRPPSLTAFLYATPHFLVIRLPRSPAITGSCLSYSLTSLNTIMISLSLSLSLLPPSCIISSLSLYHIFHNGPITT